MRLRTVQVVVQAVESVNARKLVGELRFMISGAQGLVNSVYYHDGNSMAK